MEKQDFIEQIKNGVEISRECSLEEIDEVARDLSKREPNCIRLLNSLAKLKIASLKLKNTLHR